MEEDKKLPTSEDNYSIDDFVKQLTEIKNNPNSSDIIQKMKDYANSAECSTDDKDLYNGFLIPALEDETAWNQLEEMAGDDKPIEVEKTVIAKTDSNGDGDTDTIIKDTDKNGKGDTAIIKADDTSEAVNSIKDAKDELSTDNKEITSTGKEEGDLGDNDTYKNIISSLIDHKF